MIATLAAALSIAASLAIDVPYLPQTDALCGGAWSGGTATQCTAA